VPMGAVSASPRERLTTKERYLTCADTGHVPMRFW